MPNQLPDANMRCIMLHLFIDGWNKCIMIGIPNMFNYTASPSYYKSAQIIATSPDVTVKLDLTCWNKVFHVWIALFSTVCSWHWHVEGFTGNFIPLRGCCSPTFRNMVRSILFHFWKGCRAATSNVQRQTRMNVNVKSITQESPTNKALRVGAG